MNNTDNKTKIVGICFSKISKNYHFDATHISEDIKLGDYVVVQTSRGWQIGKVADLVKDTSGLDLKKVKKVNRKATEEDIQKKDRINKRETESNEVMLRLVNEVNVREMKFIYSEINFDEKSITFHYTSESDKISNYRKLQDKVKKEFSNLKTNFHKVGPRDSAKYFGGMGACGLESRCCTRFINQFDSISIRMAKAQGISLTPSDITGMCERLRCCLNYEYCLYRDAMKGMPKRNKIVKTPNGEGKVKDIYPLRNAVLVHIPELGIKEFQANEVEMIKTQNQPNAKQRSQKNKKSNNK